MRHKNYSLKSQFASKEKLLIKQPAEKHGETERKQTNTKRFKKKEKKST